jgi:hypothetical protein
MHDSKVDLQNFLPWLSPSTVLAIREDVFAMIHPLRRIPSDQEMVAEGERMLLWIDHDLNEKGYGLKPVSPSVR